MNVSVYAPCIDALLSYENSLISPTSDSTQLFNEEKPIYLQTTLLVPFQTRVPIVPQPLPLKHGYFDDNEDEICLIVNSNFVKEIKSHFQDSPHPGLSNQSIII